jgi:hypothetical protein
MPYVERVANPFESDIEVSILYSQWPISLELITLLLTVIASESFVIPGADAHAAGCNEDQYEIVSIHSCL